MNEPTYTQDDLITSLKCARGLLEQCAFLDQRRHHGKHPDSWYRDLINRVDTLIEVEQALAKRIATVGR